MHNACWVVFHASANYPLVTALSRSQCAKRSTEVILDEDISKDLRFCYWYSHELLDVGCPNPGGHFHWINQHILKSGFLVASGLLLHSPGKQRVKVHKQAILFSPVNEDHCPFLLTFWLTYMRWICLNTWLALPQESDAFCYRFCQWRLWMWVGFGYLKVC